MGREHGPRFRDNMGNMSATDSPEKLSGGNTRPQARPFKNATDLRTRRSFLTSGLGHSRVQPAEPGIGRKIEGMIHSRTTRRRVIGTALTSGVALFVNEILGNPVGKIVYNFNTLRNRYFGSTPAAHAETNQVRSEDLPGSNLKDFLYSGFSKEAERETRHKASQEISKLFANATKSLVDQKKQRAMDVYPTASEVVDKYAQDLRVSSSDKEVFARLLTGIALVEDGPDEPKSLGSPIGRFQVKPKPANDAALRLKLTQEPKYRLDVNTALAFRELQRLRVFVSEDISLVIAAYNLGEGVVLEGTKYFLKLHQSELHYNQEKNIDDSNIENNFTNMGLDGGDSATFYYSERYKLNYHNIFSDQRVRNHIIQLQADKEIPMDNDDFDGVYRYFGAFEELFPQDFQPKP